MHTHKHAHVLDPLLSSLSAALLLIEVTADVQGLLVHLSHVLQVPQQREAAIVPWGAFRFGPAAELGSLEWLDCLKALEVGELQQVFSRDASPDVGAEVGGGGVPLGSTEGAGRQGQDGAVLTHDAGGSTLTAGQT